LSLVGWHAAEYIIGSAFAAREELAEMVFLPTGFTGKKMLKVHHKNLIFSKLYDKIVIKLYLLKIGTFFQAKSMLLEEKRRW
jgi:hypothetical protein